MPLQDKILLSYWIGTVSPVRPYGVVTFEYRSRADGPSRKFASGGKRKQNTCSWLRQERLISVVTLNRFAANLPFQRTPLAPLGTNLEPAASG